MKAIVYTKYGSPDVLKLKEIEKPIPNENEVLVKIHAASVNAADWHLLRAEPFIARFAAGLFKPKFKVLGADISGTIESIGSNVKQLKPGDEVYGDLSNYKWGGFAEYVCVDEKFLAHKPNNLTFEEAAAVPLASVTALQALRDMGKIKKGDNILINGASGGVGTFAVQIAKSFASDVTAVCSTGKIEMVQSLGPDLIIDYTKEDFTSNGITYDLILAANGYHPISDYKRSLNSDGIYVMTGGTNKQMFEAMVYGPWISKFDNKNLGGLSMKPNKKDLIFMKVLIEIGKVKPVIDKRYSLSEVPEAVRYIDKGHAAGKVVINMLS